MFDNFILRQTSAVNAQTEQLHQLSTEMQLEHPRGRVKYYQRECERLYWQLLACKISQATSFFPSTVSRLKVREKVLVKNSQRCTEELKRARAELVNFF